MRFDLVPPVLVALAVVAAPAPSGESLVCDVGALTPAQRVRHASLTETLRRAAVNRVEIANGYAFSLDLSRLPRDAAGARVSLVEVAEWVDLEARCCPFLDFGIETSGRGGPVTVRLTGGENVKAFLKTEFPMAAAGR